MSSSPFPYTCELCGAEDLTDEGMRSHTLEAHVSGRPECPFCDTIVPQPQLVDHVQKSHLHYLTPERELMAFIDDQSPGYDEDSKMTTTESCSYNTPGSINGWHSPDLNSSSSFHNGAISKNNLNYACQNGFRDSSSSLKDDSCSKAQKNINSTNSARNVNISNGVIPKTPKKSKSRQNSCEESAGSHRHHNHTTCIPSHSSGNFEGSPNKSKIALAGAGQGSPLRSQLALKLKANTPKKSIPTPSPTVQCLLCDFKSTCPKKLEEHINRAHFDLTSPSVMGNANNDFNPTLALNNPTIVLENSTLALTNAMALSPGPHSSSFQCPICERTFQSGTDLELHVNVDHKDILSPQNADNVRNTSSEDITMMEESPVSNCPVCCQPLPFSHQELMEHIEEHFSRGEEALSESERKAQRNREEQEFQLLREQYGMSPEREEGAGLRRAVYSGALSVAGYYERSVLMKQPGRTDDTVSRTHGLLEKIAQLNSQNSSILKTYLCSEVDHYASTFADRGWGCGYRNMQMLLSSLLRHPPYQALVEEHWPSPSPPPPASPHSVPDIAALQLLVEAAWAQGFDTQGSEQLGSKLHNTRKWIGACEVVTVLSSLRIKCTLIDFHKPTGADGSHPALFDWVLQYFHEQPNAFKPPLYLQHQGHSRTIIGYEKHRDGKATLLVLDPSHAPAQVRQVLAGGADGAAGAAGAAGATAVRLLRRGAAALRARQYQLLAVQGALHPQHREASKVLQSVRIP